MKKLTLKLDELEVTSFTAQETQEEVGTVHGLSGYVDCQPSYNPTQCLGCTREDGCYPSLYCSGGGCVITYQEGCMTDNYNYC
jgi:hypothetical protein